MLLLFQLIDIKLLLFYQHHQLTIIFWPTKQHRCASLLYIETAFQQHLVYKFGSKSGIYDEGHGRNSETCPPSAHLSLPDGDAVPWWMCVICHVRSVCACNVSTWPRYSKIKCFVCVCVFQPQQQLPRTYRNEDVRGWTKVITILPDKTEMISFSRAQVCVSMQLRS